MTGQSVLAELKKYERFLITTHIHPDGDAIGSELALRKLLLGLGKTFTIVNADPVPQVYSFLPGQESIKNQFPEFDFFDAVIVVDCPNPDRLGTVKDIIVQSPVINIDHHISNLNYGLVNWVDAQASSVGEMIYDLFKESGVALDDESALCLYVSLMTDTGSFRYSNTTAKTHLISADLLKFDISPQQIYTNIYETKSYNTLRLLAEVLSTAQITDDGKIGWIKASQQMLGKYEVSAEVMDDFIDLLRKVKGVQVAVFLRELEGSMSIKASLRSKAEVDVNKIARDFGGGGHSAAAGCTIEKSMDEAEILIIERIKQAIK